MSLTSHLKITSSPIKRFFEEQFPNHNTLQKETRPLINAAVTRFPEGTVPFGTIGMAFDYRIRYYFQVTPYQDLAAFQGASAFHRDGRVGLSLKCNRAEEALSLLPTSTKMQKRGPEGKKSFGVEFFVELCAALQQLNPVNRRLEREQEHLIGRYCILLAMFEEVYRAGKAHSLLLELTSSSLKELLTIAENHWLEDLCALSWEFFDKFSYLLDNQNYVLNPYFSTSWIIGGADADLIVDGCLIDIKTTIKPRLDKLWLYQLLGYVLLDSFDEYKITDISILFARQNLMLRWRLDEILPVLTGKNHDGLLDRLRYDFHDLINPNGIMVQKKV